MCIKASADVRPDDTRSGDSPTLITALLLSAVGALMLLLIIIVVIAVRSPEMLQKLKEKYLGR